MRYNTNNPVGPDGSSDPRDAYDNLANLDVAMTSDATTFMDRKGVTRVTYKGFEVKAESAMGEANRAAAEAAKAEQEAVRSELNADRAEVFSEAARTLADLYPTVEDALSVLEEGNSFQIPSPEDDEFTIVYQIVGGVAVEKKRTPSSELFRGVGKSETLSLPAITDASGNVELLGFNKDGSAVFKISQQILKQLDPYFASQLEINGIAQSQYSKTPGIFTSDFIELLGFKDDGSAVFKVSQEVANQIANLIEFEPYDPISSMLLPKVDITCWGDSMTQGAGGGGVSITTVLSSELSRTVNNRGIGGQDSLAIAIRQGAISLIISLADNQIPASGGAAVTSKSSNILRAGGVNAGTVAVTIVGVAGVISTDSSGNWTFTRSSPGSVVSVPENSVASITGSTSFIPDPSISRADTVIIWAGRNGVVGLNRQARIDCRNAILNMIKHLSVKDKRVIVVSVCNGGRTTSPAEPIGTLRYSDVIALNKELSEAFKTSYVDLRYYMVNEAIYDAGLIPTETDLADMAADCIPSSLLFDNVHFNATGYQMAGKFLARQIISRGW